MTKKALLIGINYVGSKNNELKGCVDDVFNMYACLTNCFAYDPSNIILLISQPSEKDKLEYPNINHDTPTYENIINGLLQLSVESTKLEEIWVLYSGHGNRIPDEENPKIMDDIIVPLDYIEKGIITNMDLLSIIKNINCRAFFLFDCCRSESIIPLQWSFEYLPPYNYMKKENDSESIMNENIYVFSGCKDDQNSLDVYDPILKEYVGVMTLTFIECINEIPKNSDIPILNFYMNICKKIADKKYIQTPILSSSNMNPVITIKCMIQYNIT
jgi:hypothetical protein